MDAFDAVPLPAQPPEETVAPIRTPRVRWCETPGDRPGNETQMRWDLERGSGKFTETQERFFEHWKERPKLPPEIFRSPRIWLDGGAGSGTFFAELSAQKPEVSFVAIERCRQRGRRLERIAQRVARPNFVGKRGNLIPTMAHAVPAGSLERLYLLYPCPWPKTGQRNNRWYLHPVMPSFVASLRPGGVMVIASDQRFYVDEAAFVLANRYGFRIESHGVLAPNAWNELAAFPEGRTKFERTFLANGQPCYEVVATRMAPEPTQPA